MPVNRRNSVNQLLEMWNRLQWSQRLSIIVFSVLGMTLIGAVVYFMHRVEYSVLYRDMNPDDVRAVMEKLNKEKKDYIIEGNSILVAAPETEINKLRFSIGGSGLAHSGNLGWTLFDKPQIGMTDFTVQVNFQRALEDELAATISSLKEISHARVHLVLRKDSFFEENKEEAKASVVLTLKPGAELSQANITGIKGVVAGAVSGLHSHNVSVVDAEGRPLSQSTESGEAARAEMESGIREQLEKDLSDKAVSTLAPLVGRENVHATASIELDFNSMEQTEETVNPNPQAVLSHSKSEERAGGQSAASGIPGTQSNVGTATPQTVPLSPERMRQSEVTNYEVSRLVRHTVQPKGAVRRLSVAVTLDNKMVETRAKDGKVATRSEPRSPQEISECVELVRTAVGFNESRGDVVTVKNVAFYSEPKTEEPSAAAAPWYLKWQTQTYLMPGIKYAAFILLFIIAYLVLVRPLRKRVFQALSSVPALSESGTAQIASESVPNALSGAVQAGQIGMPAAAAAASLPAGELHMPEEGFSLESASDEEIERELMREASITDMGNRKYSVMKKRLMEKAKKDPETVSQLIRTLLHEKA